VKVGRDVLRLAQAHLLLGLRHAKDLDSVKTTAVNELIEPVIIVHGKSNEDLDDLRRW
jgi:hypothetical protein